MLQCFVGAVGQPNGCTKLAFKGGLMRSRRETQRNRLSLANCRDLVVVLGDTVSINLPQTKERVLVLLSFWLDPLRLAIPSALSLCFQFFENSHLASMGSFQVGQFFICLLPVKKKFWVATFSNNSVVMGHLCYVLLLHKMARIVFSWLLFRGKLPCIG